MGHKVIKHSYGRKDGPRRALYKGLIISLVEHERITTTLSKAKEIRRHAEKAVTLGKKGDLNSRRLLISRLGNQEAADKIITNISKRFMKRPGGYTRVIKAGLRPGDMAPMAILEFVDYKLPDSAKDGDTKVSGDKDLVKRQRALSRGRIRAKKAARQKQAASRREARA
ncbi:MAG: 50S ribosomal protein L17 [Bdellovibrionota bacterium]